RRSAVVERFGPCKRSHVCGKVERRVVREPSIKRGDANESWSLLGTVLPEKHLREQGICQESAWPLRNSLPITNSSLRESRRTITYIARGFASAEGSRW